MNTTEWLLTGIFGIGVIRLFLAIRDGIRVSRMNSQVAKNQERQREEYKELRSEELKSLVSMAKDSGELSQIVKQIKEEAGL